MAAKKKKAAAKQFVSRAKSAAKPRLAAAKKAAKKSAKRAVKKAKGLLGTLAQKSAQLLLDSGLLGDAPKDAPPKRRRKS